MRGIVSPKLTDFLALANSNIALAKQHNVQFTPAILRENLNKLGALMSDSPSVSYIADKAFTLTDRAIPIRVYSPAPEQPLPVLVHFHGGGHMCGSVALYDPICRHLASIVQCVVISVEYRLAPEFPYPAGLDDCEHALIHYAELLDDVNHQDSVTIIGDSAGGAICTSLSMKSLTDKQIKIDQQILIYPSVDYTLSSPSLDSNGTGFLLETPRIKWYFEQYFQLPESLSKQQIEQVKLASPLLGPINAHLPKTLIFTAGCDPLRDEGIAYANALTAAGVEVEHHAFDGMIHAYMLLHDLVKEECMATYQHIAAFMAKA
ncbi:MULTISPECIES: alpha/beta hydrolase [Shewanella]|uniref:alpha/beta hydrolase n=1 Tax=Shewanella TaxID=22 RepID=UPI000C4780C4|nr:MULTISPECIES: alpha/beta hydrolase [Shewanella]NCQ44237.1 alpha/beta hydrolase [Shewanella frigidimarina]NCO71164.1 alpha/beta hydrolase [Shewanella vesiculosa]NCP35198.1 alpha/beta hydrolase [Shewanella vesiculosa]NCP69873.1 alpha/beta hydrolase [Shewanella vesiculosa]NCP73242.1 alpha/beta hydrolase [Shewanella vesiculosa]